MSAFETGTGFSIEIKNFRLEHRGQYKELPLYEALGGEITAIAIVETPAIGVKTIGNHKDQTITGPVMIPDLKLFRNQGPRGPERCHWYFSAETIKHLQTTFKGHLKFGH